MSKCELTLLPAVRVCVQNWRTQNDSGNARSVSPDCVTPFLLSFLWEPRRLGDEAIKVQRLEPSLALLRAAALHCTQSHKGARIIPSLHVIVDSCISKTVVSFQTKHLFTFSNAQENGPTARHTQAAAPSPTSAHSLSPHRMRRPTTNPPSCFPSPTPFIPRQWSPEPGSSTSRLPPPPLQQLKHPQTISGWEPRYAPRPAQKASKFLPALLQDITACWSIIFH